MHAKTILVTLATPNGLGPELVCRWLVRKPGLRERIVLIGPERGMEVHAKRLGLGRPWKRLADLGGEGPGLYLLEPEGLEGFVPDPGRFTTAGGLCAGLSLALASDLLLAGRADALVTCPLNKAGLQKAGFDFPGHTEFLAERAGVGADGVCMHLWGPKLRVSLVTTHPPLAQVPALVTKGKIMRCLRLTHAFVRRLGLEGPVAVCGLNPHGRGTRPHRPQRTRPWSARPWRRPCSKAWTPRAPCPGIRCSSGPTTASSRPCWPCTTTRAWPRSSSCTSARP